MGVETHWLDWKDDEPRIEMRQATLVTAAYAGDWSVAGWPCYYVLDGLQAVAFLIAGGCALVERGVAEDQFARYLGPHAAYRHGRAGFECADRLDAGALRKAPTARLRMAVLNRDGRRCRICGRRPDEHVDVFLEVHHIRPWGKYGITDPSNLLTLCHTCHAGLDPHFDPTLFDYVHPEEENGPIRFAAGVARRRRDLASALP